MLNKAELLNEMRLKTEIVELDGGEVMVSEIGAADYIRLWSENQLAGATDGSIDMAKFTPALVALSVVDDKGNRIFSDDDVALLSRSSHGPFLKLAAAARKVNGLTGDAVKNSEPSPADSSVSESA